MESPSHATGENDEHVSNEPSSTPGNSAGHLPERDSGHDAAEEAPREEREPRSDSGIVAGRRAVDAAVDDGDSPGPGQGELFSVANYRQEFHYRESPFPPAEELMAYKNVDPTFPAMLMERSGKVLDRKIENESRTIWAEAFSTIASSLALPVVTLASLGLTAWLGFNGHELPTLITGIPAVGLTITQITVVFKRRNSQDAD